MEKFDEPPPPPRPGLHGRQQEGDHGERVVRAESALGCRRVPQVIENRDLLDEHYPYKNPTLEWSRLLHAVADNVVARFLPGHESPGGSTLATQIEKYRHSPEGRTASAKQKLIQMVSATLRSYQDGRDTMAARKRVITDYINSVPLGAVPGAGEIRGLGHDCGCSC